MENSEDKPNLVIIGHTPAIECIIAAILTGRQMPITIVEPKEDEQADIPHKVALKDIICYKKDEYKKFQSKEERRNRPFWDRTRKKY